MPWFERDARMWQTVFPNMANWLPNDEADQLRFEFAQEMEPLRHAAYLLPERLSKKARPRQASFVRQRLVLRDSSPKCTGTGSSPPRSPIKCFVNSIALC
ncbi:hypothetical protein [Mesorhizobium sp. M0488]|uniref:hypothetical protein n=1 Tax=unclassified Mesorhizobium TaxID=325217 RepID=UPI00333982AC